MDALQRAKGKARRKAVRFHRSGSNRYVSEERGFIRMKKRMVCLALALCLCPGLAACKETANETAPSATTPAATETTDAKLSGKVTVYMPSPAGLADKLAAAFTKKDRREGGAVPGDDRRDPRPSGSEAGESRGRRGDSRLVVGRPEHEGRGQAGKLHARQRREGQPGLD